MKNSFRLVSKFLVFFIAFLAIANQSICQVVMRSFLSEDRSGVVETSVNLDGKPLGYQLEFLSMEKGNFFAEGEAIQRIHYNLHLLSGKEKLASFQVSVRDLIVTYYMEVKVPGNGETRTITAIYNKTNKWVKLKGVLQENCRQQDSKWGRLDGVQSYDQLLNFILSQIDANLEISCIHK
ncbi:MAG: hypothetical protein AAF502_15610 [Bacteroidota bacterium]